jgi:hypothetical protein
MADDREYLASEDVVNAMDVIAEVTHLEATPLTPSGEGAPQKGSARSHTKGALVISLMSVGVTSIAISLSHVRNESPRLWWRFA